MNENDTNGNGKRDAYAEGVQNVATTPGGESLGAASAVNGAPDRAKDTRLNAAFYGIAIGYDGMIWGSVLGFPGGIVRALGRMAAEYYGSLAAHGTTEPFRARMFDFDGLNRLIGTPEMLERGDRYAAIETQPGRTAGKR